mmetsp:Transcript_6425/g.16463  ORF Transcript_6425/g.16463 Transcript_6425/m.16463 type:complete len:420 (+) Transcript_6425:67-1326(+)|eukprot:CAMPEP_0119407902 /NCGR_PEP_ID=MMETSP1335-20130426/1627_1 /TAXON_ID=259385 /ORGANISM="Chrysoculter rhomboideus, Strain RCC1486" /LENGTH=419 /DNA_ID=CAMNT_0007432065 /DNA_START=11 /DNA_END=1270 /DNA_ORIENTATION=+
MPSGIDAIAMACPDGKCNFRPIHFKRRSLGEYDVHVEMKYCGVCHSDVHFARNDLGNATYPMVPGHELAGICVAVGKKVTKFAVGDQVGVGCFVDSCLSCKQCDAGEEQYCEKGMTLTYGGEDKHGRATHGPGFEKLGTFGGYSSQMVIHERFAIKIPKSYPLEMAGPLMCAAITMYDPMKHFGAKAGTRIAIAGLGGLGMMGIKLAKALGCEVTVISRSSAKKDYALKTLGADRYIALDDAAALAAATKSLDLILDTVSADHDVMSYIPLLDVSGQHVCLGLCTKPHSVPQLPLIFNRVGVHGSVIGGIKNTQEVVDLCAAKGIYPEIKVVPVKELNSVFEKLSASNDAGIRYVLDIGKTLTEEAFGVCAEMDPPDFDKSKPSPSTAELVASLQLPLMNIGFFTLGCCLGMLIMRANA